MATKEKYKIWMEIERIYLDEDGEECYADTDTIPLALTECGSLIEAEELRQSLRDTYNETINLE